MSITKQRSNAGKSVAIFFLVFIILEALIVVGVSFVFKNKDSTPGLMGYSMFVMDSDKMGDHVPQGSLVIAEDGCPSLEGIKKAVIAHDVPGVGTSVFWLANVSTSQDLQGVIYTVYQDKVPGKLYQLKASNIIGVASSYYKTAGAVIRFMTSNFGRVVLIAAPLFLLVLIEIIILIVNRVRYSEYEDDDDDDDYDDDEPRNSVELDDFLFGGKNTKEKIASSVQSGAEVAEELIGSERQPRRKRAAYDDDDVNFNRSSKRTSDNNSRKSKASEDDGHKKSAKPESDVSDKKPAERGNKNSSEKKNNDPYYEKASKLIDGETDEEESAKSTKSELPEEDIVFSKKPKDISASLEDLMKQMEMESNKLKDQLDKKSDNK